MAKPNKYDSHIKPNLAKIRHARINGASYVDIAQMLDISESTMYKYIRTEPDFADVMSEATADMQLTIETEAQYSLLNKLRDRTVYEDIIEDGIVVKQKSRFIPADTTAIIFALKSRNPQKWDSLGVARLKEDEVQDDLNKQILDTLEKYKPKQDD